MWNLDSAVEWIQNAREVVHIIKWGLLGEVLERGVSNTTLNVLVVPIVITRPMYSADEVQEFSHEVLEKSFDIQLQYKAEAFPGIVFVGNLPDGRHISFHLMF